MFLQSASVLEHIRDLYSQREKDITGYLYCGFCGREEPPEEEYLACSRCQTQVYCSRNCQKLHWKAHKRIQCFEKSDQGAAEINGISRRLKRFTNLFGPLMRNASLACLFLHKIDHPAASLETHVIIIKISDLTGKDVKKPHLRVDNIAVQAIADVSEGMREQLEHFWKSKRSHHAKRHACILFLEYDHRPDYGAYLSTITVRCFDNDPFLNVNADQRTVLASMMSWIQAINGIAKGERPDLYKIVARK